MHDKSILNRETDARFWAQTNYKPGIKLDKNDPVDRAMAKVWHDIFLKVQAEDKANKLVITYDDREVKNHLDDANTADAAATGHLHAAAATEDPAVVAEHLRSAAIAANLATLKSKLAAALQPPTVSPVVVHAAATEAAEATGRSAPPPIIVSSRHPAIASEAARPALPPDTIDRPTPAAAVPHPPDVDVPPYQAPAPRNPVAEVRADKATEVAIQVHEDAAKRSRDGVPSPAGTTPPRVLERLRNAAIQAALAAPGENVLVSVSTQGKIISSVFASPQELSEAYDRFTNGPSAFLYVAMFARDPDQGMPHATKRVAEMLGDRSHWSDARQIQQATQQAIVPASPRKPLIDRGGMIAIGVGGLGLLGLIGIAMKSRSRSSRGAYGAEPAWTKDLR